MGEKERERRRAQLREELKEELAAIEREASRRAEEEATATFDWDVVDDFHREVEEEDLIPEEEPIQSGESIRSDRQGIIDEEEQIAQIDRFYRPNTTNELYQEVLDRDYERYRQDRESAVPERESEPTRRDEENSLDDFLTEDLRSLGLVADVPEGKVASETTKAEEPIETEQDTPVTEETNKEAPADQSVEEETFIEKETSAEKKTWDTGLKIGVAILAIVAVVGLILLIMHQVDGERFFGTGTSAPQEETIDVTVPAGDLTGIIQDQIDKVQNGNIADIAYNGELHYDANAKKHPAPEIAKTKTLEDEEFPYNTQEAVTGAIIAYLSGQVPEGQSLERLQIGEIRKDEKSYYAWIAKNDQRQILQIQAGENGQMTVVKEYNL